MFPLCQEASYHSKSLVITVKILFLMGLLKGRTADHQLISVTSSAVFLFLKSTVQA